MVGNIRAAWTTVGSDGSTTCRDIGAVNPHPGMLAEDKVNSSSYETLPVNLVANFAEKRVLISVKPDAIIALLISPSTQS